ncbi:MAG: DNA gyrase inhibitor YacG [Pirellulales bacterium]|nr:DNA gyrase inhibitor YacG [Pirellulales bacterium]
MRCPTCNTDFQTTASDANPFCSEQCRVIDLGRWLDECNSLPYVPSPDDDETPEDNWSGERYSAPEEEAS